MSRSYRHTPIRDPFGDISAKECKRLCNRGVRRLGKAVLKNGDPEEVLLPLPNEVSDPWGWPNDHRGWFDLREEGALKRMRK